MSRSIILSLCLIFGFAVVNAETLNIHETSADYIEVMDGCNHAFSGDPCVNVRSGPGTDYDVVIQLRRGVLLMVSDVVNDGEYDWYKISFANEWLRYPERIYSDMWVRADLVKFHHNLLTQEITYGYQVQTNKKIVVSIKDQMIYAYEGKKIVFKDKISTGIIETPTPRGKFSIYKKMPSRYMQGPIPGISTHEYDLPGVAWNMYFTRDGAVFHGAYWHNSFGKPRSNGCVNMRNSTAEWLYKWADIGTPVTIY